MINKTRPSDTHAPPREDSRSEKGLRLRETAMPSTSPGIAPYGIANSIVLNLNLLDDADDPMRQAMAAGVSAYVVAGLQPQRLASVLRVAIARFEQDRSLRQELARARSELSERKVIDRAKGLLMKRQGITEEAAYALLRKPAMDRGMKIADVARQLIDLAPLLG